MDIKLSINCGFDSVFLVNGKLVEGGDIVYGENEVVYITVLPLSALLLPYTTKLVGGSVRANTELCKCYCLPSGNYFLRLLARHNYIYSVPQANIEQPTGLVEKFFLCVTGGKTADARACLSEELNGSIDDKSLLGFFDGFVDIVESDRLRGLYYLIDKDNRGILYNFAQKNNTIDNIVEV